MKTGEIITSDGRIEEKFKENDKTSLNNVLENHLNYLRSGAQLVRTRTYYMSLEYLKSNLNLSQRDGIDLIKETVRLSHLARNKFLKENSFGTNNIDIPWVVGSVGPLSAYLIENNQYTGNYADTVTKDFLREWHKDRIKALIDAGVNALAFEDLPCLMEAEAVTEFLCDEYPKIRFWVSFLAKDSKYISHGEQFKDAVMGIWNLTRNRHSQHNLLAVGVDSNKSMDISTLLNSVNGDLLKHQRIRLICHTNLRYNAENNDECKHCLSLENCVSEWINLGARIVGGHRNTSFEEIGEIRKIANAFNLINLQD